MRRCIYFLAAASLTATAGVAGAAETPTAATSVAATSVPNNARQLSRLLNPEDKSIEVGLRALEVGFDTAMAKTADDAAFYRDNPGLREAILGASRPIVRKYLQAEMSSVELRCAQFYASRFNAAEIDELIGFYASPTGMKLIEGMYAGADLTALMGAIGEDGEEPLTATAVDGFTRSTVTRIMPALDEHDKKALANFATKPLFPKLQKALPEFSQLSAEIANQPSPEMDAEIEGAVTRAVEDYFAKTKPSNAT